MRYKSTRPRNSLDDEDFASLASFRSVLRRFFAFSEEAAEQVGMTSQQYQAMLAIRAHLGTGAMTIGELAAQLFIRHHSAVGLVDRLVSRGLVTREAAARDGRLVCVALTPSGTRALGSVAAKHRGELMRMRPEMIALLESLG